MASSPTRSDFGDADRQWGVVKDLEKSTADMSGELENLKKELKELKERASEVNLKGDGNGGNGKDEEGVQVIYWNGTDSVLSDAEVSLPTHRIVQRLSQRRRKRVLQLLHS
jgi:hypothetical protein